MNFSVKNGEGGDVDGVISKSLETQSQGEALLTSSGYVVITQKAQEDIRLKAVHTDDTVLYILIF